MENQKALYAEAKRLGLKPAISLSIMLDAYERLETKKSRRTIGGIPLGLAYISDAEDPEAEPLPPMPELFSAGRATAELCLISTLHCYVVVTRASRKQMASGPFSDMEADSLLACFFVDRRKGVSAFVRVGDVWQPLRGQLGPKARKGCCQLFEVMLKIAEGPSQAQGSGDSSVKKNQWTTEHTKKGG